MVGTGLVELGAGVVELIVVRVGVSFDGGQS